MSKVGKVPVKIPSGVDVTITGNEVKVKGSKGELSYNFLDGVVLTKEEDQLVVSVAEEPKKNLWWLTRTLIANMVHGVTEWYEKKLTIIGVGYWAKMQWSTLVLSLGFSHPVNFEPAQGVSLTIDKDAKWNAVLLIQGIDKQKVGEVASKIRSLKKPEPYKGKGIRYSDEVIKLKPGKSAK